MHQPTLTTKRLVLRPFTHFDVSRVAELAGDRRIADVTAHIPHPYSPEIAVAWIKSHEPAWEAGHRAAFAVTLKESGLLIGTVSLMRIKDETAEIGYWTGVEYWNNGYSTEASQALIEFGFQTLSLKRINGSHLARNPASGRVLEKCGFTRQRSITSQLGLMALEEIIELYWLEPNNFE